MKYFFNRFNLQTMEDELVQIEETEAIEMVVDSIADGYSGEGGELERMKEELNALRTMITVLAQAWPDTGRVIQKFHELAPYGCRLVIEEDSDES